MLRHTVRGARFNLRKLLLCVTWARAAAYPHPRPVESAAGPPGVGRAEGRTGLSSAILYVAIVAIWAGVLIPRWLRRDTSAVERADDEAGTADTEATPTTVPAPPARETAPRSRDDAAPAERPAARPGPTPPAGRPGPTPPAERPAGRQAPAARTAPAARQAPPERVAPAGRMAANRPVPPARATAPTAGRPDRRPGIAAVQERSEERKKVLAARRRLLGMLAVLTLGSCTLAATKMAAWWVIVPPFVMLAGYLGLLREASKADAERRELARASVAGDAARRAAPPAVATSAAPMTSPAPAAGAAAAAAPAAPVARPAPLVPDRPAPLVRDRPAPLVPDAEVIDISGSLGEGGEEFYDQYADAKLRAVGDLPIPGRAPRRPGFTRRPAVGLAPACPNRRVVTTSRL